MPNFKLKELLHDYEKQRKKSPMHASSYKLESEASQAKRWAQKRSYQLYLQSDEWKAKRDAVIERDERVCIFCGDTAEHVHHLNYDRIFNESLYDLVAACSECHRALHPEKLKR